jgi:CBS domain-containing protein
MRLDTTVGEALAMLVESNRSAEVVEDDDGRLVGVVTIDALRGRPGWVPRPEARLAEVMDLECVRVPPGADVLHTLQLYRAAAWESVGRRRPGARDVFERRAQSFVSSTS